MEENIPVRNFFDRSIAFKIVLGWIAALALRILLDPQSRQVGIFWFVMEGGVLCVAAYILSFAKRWIENRQIQLLLLTLLLASKALFRLLKPFNLEYYLQPELLGLLPALSYNTLTRLTQFVNYQPVARLLLISTLLALSVFYAWLVVCFAGAPAASAELEELKKMANERYSFLISHLISIFLAAATAAIFYLLITNTSDLGLFHHPAVLIFYTLLFPGIASGLFLGIARIRRLRDIAEAFIAPIALNCFRVWLHRGSYHLRLDWAIELYMLICLFPAALIGAFMGCAAVRHKSWATRITLCLIAVVIVDGLTLSMLPELHPNYAHPELQVGSLSQIGRLRARWLGKRLNHSLESHNATVRHGSLILLAAQPFASLEALDNISRIIVDGDENEFTTAVAALPRTSGNYPYLGLQKYVGKGTDNERVRVARAMRFIISDEWSRPGLGATILLKLLKDQNPEVRMQSALSIKTRGAAAFRAVPNLLNLARDQSREANEAARDAFVNVTDPDARLVLADWWQWQSGDHSHDLRRRLSNYPPEATAGLAIRILRLGHPETLKDLTPVLIMSLKKADKREGSIIWAERAAEVQKYKSLGWDIKNRQDTGQIQFPYHDGIREAIRLLQLP